MTANLNAKRHGHRWRQLKAEFKWRCQQRNLPCHRCNQPIDYSAPSQQPNAFEADHIQPVIAPEARVHLGQERVFYPPGKHGSAPGMLL